MIELYIENSKVDLSENVKISLNYQSTDTTSPSAIKNSFSTTVKLKGTENNNRIFGHLYRIDALHTNYDANKRVKFDLIDNGDVIESGYVQLNSIDRTPETITYNITLFGGLGDFFYSLMYNDDGTERSLKDMYFGWYENLAKENSSIITTWDKRTLYEQWSPYVATSYSQYTLDLTDGIKNVLNPYYSRFSIKNGELSWSENTYSSVRVRTTLTPISLPVFQDSTLVISMTEEVKDNDDLCIVFTGSDNYDQNYNDLKDVKMVVKLSDIYKDTLNNGQWEIKLNPTWKYMWVTANGTSFRFWVRVKIYTDLFSNSYFGTMTSTSNNRSNVYVDTATSSSNIVYVTSVYFDSYYNASIPTWYNNTNFYFTVSSVYGTVLGLTGTPGIVFTNSSGTIVGRHNFNIKAGSQTKLINTIEQIQVPQGAVYMTITYLKGFTPFFLIRPTTLSYVQSDIVAIPAYNGVYEDFDSETVLVSVGGLNAAGKQYLPSTRGEYGLYPGPGSIRLAKVGLPRELVEWEVRDIRAKNQRMGIRLSSILSAISNPENNGGYNVIFDSDVYNSPYFNDAWVILNRPDFTNNIIGGEINMAGTLASTAQTGNMTTNLTNLNYNKNSSFRGNVNIVNLITGTGSFNNMYNSTFYSLTPAQENKLPGRPTLNQFIWSGLALRFVLRKNGVKRATSNVSFIFRGYDYAFGTTKPLNDAAKTNLINAIRTTLSSKYTDETISEVNICERTKSETPNVLTDKEMSYTVPIDVKFTTNQDIGDCDVVCYIDRLKCTISFDVDDYTRYAAWKYTVESISNSSMWYYNGALQPYSLSVNTQIQLNLKMYNNLVGSTFPEGYIDKSTLFYDTPTPFKYLTDFTKMLNLKYVYDQKKKNVFITNNYYTGEEEDILVDVSRNINITPSTLTKKYINIGLEAPDTYAKYLYSLNNKYEYGEVNIDKEYNFNNDTLNMIDDDNIFKNVIPYRLSSHYLDENETSIPTFIKTPTIEYTLFKTSGEQDTETLSLPFTNYEIYNDESPKLCMFDRDNGYMDDCMNSLCFYAGKTKPLYILSDPFDSMMTLNNGNECYYFTQTADAYAYTYITAPLFLKTNKQGYSLNITQPNAQFLNGELNNITLTIYDWWKNYVEDIFSLDTKKITVYAHFNSYPKDAMRKFYFFDNQWWVIVEIKNWCKDNYFHQCTLVKVNDKYNYLRYGN